MKAGYLSNKTARLDSIGSFKVGFGNICWEKGEGLPSLEKSWCCHETLKKKKTQKVYINGSCILSKLFQYSCVLGILPYVQ